MRLNMQIVGQADRGRQVVTYVATVFEWLLLRVVTLLLFLGLLAACNPVSR